MGRWVEFTFTWQSYNSWFGAPGAPGDPGAPGAPRAPGAPEEPQRVSCRWIADVTCVAEGNGIHISDFCIGLKMLEMVSIMIWSLHAKFWDMIKCLISGRNEEPAVFELHAGVE